MDLRLSLLAEAAVKSTALLAVCAAMILFGSAPQSRAQTATTTTLAVTAGGSAVTTVAQGTVVTLTASVNGGGFPVRLGQVNFCDATPPHCSGTHLLATAQMTFAGTATFKFRPGVGSHSYMAKLLADLGDSASVSATVLLTVTPAAVGASETGISASGSPGNYTLTAMVGDTGAAAPTGTVTFLDTTNGNAVLGTATLGASVAGLSFFNSATPAVGAVDHNVAAGDFNNDGILDLAVTNGCLNGGGCADTVTILLGNGDGTFTAMPETPVTGLGASFIGVADFNQDGSLDLAIANQYASTFTILLGNGDGTFTSAKAVYDGSPLPVTIGDFNGDGIPDLASAEPGPCTYVP